MGEKNDAFCAYMEKKDIFADFIKRQRKKIISVRRRR